MHDQTSLDRRGVLKAAGGTLSAVPVFTLSSGRTIAAEGPVGVHVGVGNDPSTSLRVGWTGPKADEAYVEYQKSPNDPSEEETADGARSQPNNPLDIAGFAVRDVMSVVAGATAENIPGENQMAYVAELTDLEPDTEYAYRVVLDCHESEEYTAQTAPDGRDGFTVTAWGDHGINGQFNRADSDAPNDNIELAGSLEPDLHLGVGDISYANGYPETWNAYFGEFEEFFAARPQLTVPGNHEREPGQGFQQYDARLDALLPSAPGNRWFDVIYGNALFVGLNSEAGACPSSDIGAEEYVPITDMRCGEPSGETYETLEAILASEEQGRYLEEVLAEADKNPDIQWKIVFTHSGWWTTSEHAPRDDLQRLWEPIINEHNVDLVITGHNHVYERTYPMPNGDPEGSGTTYVTTGASGTSFYTFEEPQPEWMAFRQNTTYGTFVFEIKENHIHCRYKTLGSGDVIDEFKIEKRTGSEPAQKEIGSRPLLQEE